MVDNNWVITMQPVEGSQESLLLKAYLAPPLCQPRISPTHGSAVLRAARSSATASSGQLGYHLLCEILGQGVTQAWTLRERS